MLKCTRCKKSKIETDFQPRKDRPKGYTSWCYDCINENARKSGSGVRNTRKARYGVTEEIFIELAAKQGGRCGICNEKLKVAHVDHDHKSKIVRGLLCRNCNIGLGNFKDDIAHLEKAINYLKLNGGIKYD